MKWFAPVALSAAVAAGVARADLGIAPNPNDSDLWDTEKLEVNEAIPAMNLAFTKKCWTAVVRRAEKDKHYAGMASWYTYCMSNEYKKVWDKIQVSEQERTF